MEGQQFDSVSKRLGETTNRRSAVRLLFTLLLGGLAGASVGRSQTASAAPDCCPADYPRRCGLRCVNLRNDSMNCGACGHSCPWGTICRTGVCRTAKAFTATAIARETTEARADRTATARAQKTATRRAQLTKTAAATTTPSPTPTMVCTPSSTMSCYTGPAGTQGIGQCKAGLMTCNANGSGWGPCIGEVLPQTEVCNTVDDDCDGVIDNGSPCPDSINGRPQVCVSGVCMEA